MAPSPPPAWIRLPGGRLPRAAALAAAWLLACASAPTAPPDGSGRPSGTGSAVAARAPGRVVLLSISGLVPQHYRPGAPSMPALARLAGEGISASALHTVAPDGAFPVHATLVTGRTPAGHGIVADRLIGERGVRDVHFWHASRLEAPTLWDRARAARLSAAALGWPTTAGASIDLLVPDLDTVREDDTWLSLQERTASPALVPTLRSLAPGGDDGPPPGWPAPGERDALVQELACRLLAQPDPPQLWLLHLGAPAEAMERHGPESVEARAALATADRQLAALLDCVVEAGLADSTAWVVVGDRHPRPVHTRVDPNVALADAGLAERWSDAPGLSSWSALVRSNGGSAFVYAVDESAALEARQVLGDLALVTGAFQVVPARELASLGGDPQAWFALEAEPGFVFGDDVAPPVLSPSRRRGAAGHLRPGRRIPVGFVAFGAGLRRGLDAAEVRQLDVAPTVAALLDLDLDTAAGRRLVGLLTPPLAEEAR